MVEKTELELFSGNCVRQRILNEVLFGGRLNVCFLLTYFVGVIEFIF